MIWIERHRHDEEGHPIRPDAQWSAEAEAQTKIAENEGGAHKVTNLYKDEQVKIALEKLFNDKCAYCESKITATSAWDVEHFRPKGRVAERREHPGYYWLAYEWTNLFPSCQYCNQRRKDQARWGDLTVGPAAGKLDQFPLADESTRAMNPAHAIELEDHLLLDPCKDRPEEVLTFDARGRALSLNGNVRGAASIDVFHLNRRRLRDLRQSSILKVVDFLRVIDAQREAGKHDLAADLEEFLTEHYLQDEHEYAAVARCVVNDPVAFGVSPVDS